MKNFIFRELLLVSFREKKARRIRFDPEITVIRGNNETGKSSLIKSIFRTFGAEPAKVHPNWINADVWSVIHFEIDGTRFTFLRHGNSYAAFNSKGQLLGRFQSVTKDLAPFFARLTSFGLRLPNRQGKFGFLPPAYYFLPFYLDQDASWQKQWSGFSGLEQYANWKHPVTEYHAGIRGNEYYEAQASKFEAETELNKVRRRREGLEEAYYSLSRKFAVAEFSIDFNVYRAEVEELLKECEALHQREEAYKARICELRNQRRALQTQLDITLHARDEFRLDYDYANDLAEDEVACPTCGACYANSFAERFAIATDEDYCADLALRLNEELNDIDARIAREGEGSNEVIEELVAIERLLGRREGEIALGDLIRQEGRRELRDVMTRDIGDLRAEEGRVTTLIESASARMKELDSKEHRETIRDFYEQKMRLFLRQLDVQSVEEKVLRRVDAVIRDTGSELPRALLAYQMALLHVAARFGSAAVAPLVIDSPNQQDQDDPHLQCILTFIRDQRPSNLQLVLSLVDTGEVEFGGTEVVLDQKYSVLSEGEYKEVVGEVQYFVDEALEGSVQLGDRLDQ